MIRTCDDISFDGTGNRTWNPFSQNWTWRLLRECEHAFLLETESHSGKIDRYCSTIESIAEENRLQNARVTKDSPSNTERNTEKNKIRVGS